jgi:L-ribulose-5-phosphate 3-epimerase UlaE
MTVQIDIDEKMWAEAETIAKDLNINFSEMLIDTFRKDLYLLRDEKNKKLSVNMQKKEVSDEEKLSRTLESFRKFPQQPDEYEIWQDEQVWEKE